MEMLTVDQILGAKDFIEEILEVPEWGGRVKVKTLSMGARYDIAEKSVAGSGQNRRVDSTQLALLTVLHGVVEPKFSAETVLKLAEKNASAVEKIVAAVWRVSSVEPETIKNGLPQA